MGTEGRWQPTLQGDLLRPLQGPLGVSGTRHASGEEKAEGAGCLNKHQDSGVSLNRDNDRGPGGVSLQEAGLPMGSAAGGPDERQAFLAARPGCATSSNGARRSRRGQAKASSPAAAEHGDRGPGTDECRDLQHPGPTGNEASVPNGRKGLPGQTGGSGAEAPDRDAEASGADGLDAELHATGAGVSSSAAGWLPHGAGQLDRRGLPDELGLDKVSLIS